MGFSRVGRVCASRSRSALFGCGEASEQTSGGKRFPSGTSDTSALGAFRGRVGSRISYRTVTHRIGDPTPLGGIGTRVTGLDWRLGLKEPRTPVSGSSSDQGGV